ncbi:MAG: cyclic nucleotide-binding domain-containing protein [Pseudomonadota bacterium]
MAVDHERLQSLIRDGKYEEAMRCAIVLLQANATDLHAWYELSKLCLELGEKKAAALGLTSAGREYAENGNLPMAIICIKDLEAAGEETAEHKKDLAAMYGKGSKRVRDRAMPVPPLPSAIKDEKLEKLPTGKEELLKEAAKLITLADESAKMARGMRDESLALPYFPMFGALAEENFIEIIGCFSPRRFHAGDFLIRQGEVAAEVYLLAKGELEVLIEKKARDDTGKTMKLEFKHIATLGPGTLIGEMGMVAKTPRSAHVKANSSGLMLSAEIDSFEELSERIPEIADVIVAFCEIRLMENVMATSPILLPIEAKERAEVLRTFERIYVPAGDIIIQEGEQPKGIYVIVSGEVGVTKTGKEKLPDKKVRSETKDMIFITTLVSGNIFGEISTVMNKPATATVHSVTDAALLFMPSDKFMTFTKTYPQVFQKIYEIVSERESEITEILSRKTSTDGEIIE